MNIQKCVDCQGDMEMGCLLDHSYTTILSQRYAKINIADTNHYGKSTFRQADFRDLRKVITYRCLKCNKLYHYAEDSVEIPNLKKWVGSRTRVVLLLTLSSIVLYAAVIFFLNRAGGNTAIP